MIEEADQLQFIDMLKLGLPLPPEAYVDRFTKVFKITAADLQGRMRRLEREIMRDIRNEHRTGAVCVVGDTNPLGYANTKTAVKTATAVTSTARVSIVARLGITRSLAILGELLRRQKVAREKLLQLIASSQPDSHLSQSPEVVAACAFCDSLDAVFLLSQQERDRTVVDVVKQLASVMTATSLEGVLSTTLRSNPTFASFASVITNEPLKEAVREFAKSAHFCSVLAQDILKRFELMTASESELWPTSTDEDCIVVLSPMMGGLFGLSSATNDNFPSINNEAADDFAFNVTMQELLKEQKEERDVHSSAEVLLRDYFDIVSRKEGPVITRQGAGRIQQALLRGIMDVSAVKFFQGAVIYNGRMDQLRDSGVLARQIEERYQASDFRDEVDYTLVMNEAIPDLSGDIYSPDNVLNAVMSMGVSPALVVYPRAWNTTLSQVLQVPLFGTLRKVLSATALSTSLLYAADRTGALLPGSAFLGTGAVPAYLLPLLVTSSLMQNAAAVTERLVAMTKNVTMSQAFVPALSGTLFNFGHRSVYLNKTRTRADLFDTALSGVLTSLTLSTAAIATGLQLTARASTEAVSGFPTVPVSLLQINTFISQVFLPKFGELYQTYNPSALPEGLIPEPQVHLHWLTLVGITTFIAATLQLIPIGNSAGSKLLSATFGRQVAQNVSYIFAILRLVLYTAMFLNLGNVWAGPQITKARVLLDFLFFSQLLGNDHVWIMDCFLHILCFDTHRSAVIFIFFISFLFHRVGSVGGTNSRRQLDGGWSGPKECVFRLS